jgi:prephenate dehydratase
MKNTISFNGTLGSYAHQACTELYEESDLIECPSFESAISAVSFGEADMVVLPLENSVVGRVADIHALLPKSNLYIINEHYIKVNHHLLVNEGATIGDIKTVYSHVQALMQCSNFINVLQIEKKLYSNTAGAAKYISERQNKSEAAIASKLAGKLYSLKSIRSNIQNSVVNTTRFIVMSRTFDWPPIGSDVMSSLLFTIKNTPASLYKSLGGFATNGVNVTKLESYLIDERFTAARFYIEIEGHPKADKILESIEEVKFFSEEMKILGVYPKSPFRNVLTHGFSDKSLKV